MVYDKVKDLGLDEILKKDKIEVKVDNKRVTVIMAWTENVDVLGVYQKDLNFNINVTQ
ncbi:hypothetical protein MBAV_000015 [Candidatus Magnetobacterium bavaricum]|uniref:Uncharacterized protein n=1 Tax=Candidatus Magnetobacterium bavaricum TaxID=29290 RepID=A0A0F3H4D3_9BACT|nr:hypothetical protein MBAV_000015 [Candidatus Magnetobacterium bavaricum]